MSQVLSNALMFEPQALLQASAYPHPVEKVRLVETHMSWVFLTGTYVYKVKKPVQFAFADFSTLSQREYFCHRELELNRRFAPDIYIGVVPIFRSPDRGWWVGEGMQDGQDDSADVEEWAVKMHQFPDDALCSVLLDRGSLTESEFFGFGQKLAELHSSLPIVQAEPIEHAIQENFTSLAGLKLNLNLGVDLAFMQSQAEAGVDRHSELLAKRATSKFARRCHGDLHLSNLVVLDGEIQAFDCLEFNEALSSIDVWADVAFLFMDLSINNHKDLAYAFVDGYLDTSGDYDGAVLLPLFSQYRAMVRAKVAALGLAQQRQAPELKVLQEELETYLNWADGQVRRPPGRVLVTHGYSGSGKSYWSAKLVPSIAGIRIRSDIYRKVKAGFTSRERTARHLSGGLYTASNSQSLYADMARLAVDLALAGENVIVDAANLRRSQREGFYQVCGKAGVISKLVSFQAPDDVLRSRLMARKNDPSEADEEVLDWQIQNADPMSTDEPVVLFDSQVDELGDLLSRLED